MGFEIQFGESRYEKFLSILDHKFGLIKLAENFREFCYFFTFMQKI